MATGRRGIGDHLSKGPTPDLFHCEVEAPIAKPAKLVDRHDVRMLKLRRGLCLLDEAVQDVAVLNELGPNDSTWKESIESAPLHVLNPHY